MKDDLKKTNKLKDFILTHKYMAWLLLWIVYLLWYFILNKTPLRFHNIHIPMDDRIPFLEGFVVFYILWFPYIVFSLVFTLLKSRRDFLLMLSLIFISLFSSMIVCTVFPSEVDLRPAESEMNHNFFTWIVKIIYAVDNPRNVFPSMHCIVAIVITAGFFGAESMKGKVLPKVLFSILSIGICLSTFFIKQHSFADFMLAMGMSIPACLISYFVVLPKITRERAAETADLPTEAAEPAGAVLFVANDETADASAEASVAEVAATTAEDEKEA